MSVDEQSALSRKHAYIRTGKLCYFLSPNAGSVNHYSGIGTFLFFGDVAIHLHAHHAVAVLNHTRHLVIGEHVGAVKASIKHVSHSQAEWVDSAIGHLDSANKVLIGSRFEAQGFFGVDGLGIDAGTPARFDERRLIVEVVLGQCDEQPIGFLHTMAGNFAQRHILANAFLGTLAVGHGIARSAVQQPVIAARCAGGEVVALHQQGGQTTHGTIACSAGTRDAASYHNHIVLFHSVFSHCLGCGLCYDNIRLFVSFQFPLQKGKVSFRNKFREQILSFQIFSHYFFKIFLSHPILYILRCRYVSIVFQNKYFGGLFRLQKKCSIFVSLMFA